MNNADPSIKPYVRELQTRCLQEGGFSRPDAVAWAILALRAAGETPDLVLKAQKRLMTNQATDGRISLDAGHPGAFWPTALAVLAWQGSAAFENARARAVAFLLQCTGTHWPRKKGSPIAHDTNIKGWSWTADTHAWVQPTALALIALRSAGYHDHERVLEGKRLLLDRQLPDGGWNYGNTRVFGKILRPMPACTAMALGALAMTVPETIVTVSLQYLKEAIKTIRSPLSLGWGVLALSAWGNRPPAAFSWIVEALQRQQRYGLFDTALLSLLLVAFFEPDCLTQAMGESP
ncbi:MAG: terpene cyclase/mutase family protein [Deltaproteobacteria bacterium]|nr:terpene cyclase/mutase family protein [Deltaproteobacteria bacterium]